MMSMRINLQLEPASVTNRSPFPSQLHLLLTNRTCFSSREAFFVLLSGMKYNLFESNKVFTISKTAIVLRILRDL